MTGIVDSPELATVIRDAMTTRLVDVHTGIPAIVESYDNDAQTANVRPELSRIVRDGAGVRRTEELPVIPCVPVVFLSAGPFFISFPVTKGTTGMLFLAEYSIDRWRAGSPGDPGDERRHGLSGATFVPGLRVSGAALGSTSGSAIRLGHDPDYAIEITDSGIKLPNDAIEFLARADRTLSELQSIVNGFNTHTHTGVTVGAGVTGTPSVPLTAPSDPASDTVQGT